jgi:hypothetical protein
MNSRQVKSVSDLQTEITKINAQLQLTNIAEVMLNFDKIHSQLNSIQKALGENTVQSRHNWEHCVEVLDDIENLRLGLADLQEHKEVSLSDVRAKLNTMQFWIDKHDAQLQSQANDPPIDNNLTIQKTPIFDEFHALMISEEEKDKLKKRVWPSWFQEYFSNESNRAQGNYTHMMLKIFFSKKVS